MSKIQAQRAIAILLVFVVLLSALQLGYYFHGIMGFIVALLASFFAIIALIVAMTE